MCEGNYDGLMVYEKKKAKRAPGGWVYPQLSRETVLENRLRRRGSGRDFRKIGSKNRLAKRRRMLLERDPRCQYCFCDLNEITATVDHAIPKSKGGSSKIDNLKLACSKCNHDKGDRMPEPYLVRE